MSARQTPGERLDAWLDEWPARSQARDSAFAERVVAEIAALDDLGYSNREKRKALCARLYVATWACCPRWMGWVDKLPAPLKWRDGVTYKRPKHAQVKTLIYRTTLFLSCNICQPVGTKYTDKLILVIHEFQELTLPELIDGLPGGQAIELALTEFAKEHGMRMTNNLVHFLRDMTRG